MPKTPSIIPPKTWKIILGGRVVEIRWSNRSLYRLQSLPGGYDLGAVGDDRRSLATIADLIWAMLEPKDRLPAPEDVADALPLADADHLGQLMATVSEAIADGQKGTEPKNACAGPSLTPGSSVD